MTRQPAKRQPETRVALDDIRVEDRHRADLGDIAALAASIADIGLINPITVTPDHRMIAGARRLAAVRTLGWTDVPVRVVDTLDDASARLRAERDENTCRKEMTVSELMDLAAALEALERPKAATRQIANLSLGSPTKNGEIHSRGDQLGTTPDDHPNGKTREIVAKALGVSSGTYQRARMVHRAAHNPNQPAAVRAAAADLLGQMDRGEISVNGGYRQFRHRRDLLTAPPIDNPLAKAAGQRKAINTALAGLAGICHGLNQIPAFDPEITKAEAAQWADGFGDSRLTLERIIKRLKEFSNAET
jgi:hypothetical protein